MSINIHSPYPRCCVAACLLLLALPGHAAKKQEAAPFTGDLTVPTIKHGVECPLPKQRPCTIRKPVGKGYRVLSYGVTLEDLGEYWLADLSRIKDPKSNKAWLQILGANGDLHEIEILFPKETVAKEVKTPKEPVPANEERKQPAP